jgi:Flp pilus assembly protein TadG
MNPRRKGKKRRRGTALVEAALVLPLVLLFLLGIMEYGRYLMTLHLFTNAVTSGASYAAKHTDSIYLNGSSYGNANSNVTTIVTNALCGQSLSGQAVNVYQSDALGNNLGTWTSAQAGQYICVQITGTYQFMVPKLLGLPSTTTPTFQCVRLSEGN